MEDEKTHHVRLAERKRERLLVVRRLRVFGDGLDRRGLRAAVERCLRSGDLRLDPVLGVEDRQGRSRLGGAVEGLAQQALELRVVGDSDRRRVRVGEAGRDGGVLGVRMDRQRVHHRPGEPARSVGGAEILDEHRRGVGVAAGAGAIDAARRDRAAEHPGRRIDLLQRLVGPGEHREVGGCRRVAAVGIELGQPEPVQIRLVPDDEVAHVGDLTCETRRVGGEVALVRVRQRRRAAAEVVDGDERLDPVELRRLGDVANRRDLGSARLRLAGIPDRGDADGVEPGELEEVHLRLRLRQRRLADLVLGCPNEHRRSAGVGSRGQEKEDGCRCDPQEPTSHVAKIA